MATSQYTTGAYAQNNPTWHDEDAEHKADAVAEVMVYCGLRPRTITDVGCGTGGVLARLKEQRDALGLDAVVYEGWDIAGDAIKRARQREGDRLQFVKGDFLASEREADLILCLDVFEHLPDEVEFLRQLRTRAKWFVFRIPLDLSALDAVRPKRMIEARRRYGHLHAYNRRLALEVLLEAGYNVVHERYDRVPPKVSGTRRRLVQLARRGLFRLAPTATVRALGGWSLLVVAEPA